MRRGWPVPQSRRLADHGREAFESQQERAIRIRLFAAGLAQTSPDIGAHARHAASEKSGAVQLAVPRLASWRGEGREVLAGFPVLVFGPAQPGHAPDQQLLFIEFEAQGPERFAHGIAAPHLPRFPFAVAQAARSGHGPVGSALRLAHQATVPQSLDPFGPLILASGSSDRHRGCSRRAYLRSLMTFAPNSVSRSIQPFTVSASGDSATAR